MGNYAKYRSLIRIGIENTLFLIFLPEMTGMPRPKSDRLLDEQMIAEPYFAEVMGAVLAWGHPKPNFLQRVAALNPLALFHALRLLGFECDQGVLQAINEWLDNPATNDDSNRHLRWEVAAMMAETDSPEVPALVR
ncbi:MAG: hypothetical protein ABFD82_03745, partial [Syntrophaceae bacterium]